MIYYRIENIRNIALVRHTACGKTTLVEALLYQAGIRSTPGSVEKGDTVSDFDPQEQRHQHSLSASLIGFYQGRRINQNNTHSNGQITIKAQVPLVELRNYASRLKSLASGAGPIPWNSVIMNRRPSIPKRSWSSGMALTRKARLADPNPI